MWEGIFYFGLDGDGLINSHIFDRKISNLRPSLLSPKLYPWITALPSWQTEKLQPGLIPIPNSNVPSLAEVLMTALEPPTDSSDE